jgi:lipoprotein-anchoring transpeptidase ErfK/SrfK
MARVAALTAPAGAFADTSPRSGLAQAAAILEAMPPPVPTAQQALRDGVLIVVSLKSQQLFVFRDGQPWASSRVSTGKKGHETPTGEFPILQKKVHHRSNLYSNAPMPYMQRLTWDGVALHAGRIPGYAASHGCIRLPADFAQDLYKITDFNSSVVVVTDRPIASAEAARRVI